MRKVLIIKQENGKYKIPKLLRYMPLGYLKILT